MKPLHPTQEALLKLLEANVSDPLTVRELQDRLDLTSTSLVAHHIQQLEKKGYLVRNPYNSQDYRLLKSPEKIVVYVNLYGMAQCGPNGSILSGDPIDRIPVSRKLFTFPPEDAFLMRAKGNSMKPLIKEGDLIVARKTSRVKDGALIICVNDGKCLIKRYRRDGDHVLLESENSSQFPPFVANEDDFRIEGEVRSVLTTFA